MSKACYPLVSLAAFGLLTICGVAAMIVPSARSKIQSVAVDSKIPQSDEWYLSYYNGGHDHASLFHDFHQSADSLKSADVLFLGNSRMLYAIDSGELETFERRTNLRCYVLAFAFGETCTFPQKVIEKYDLHPRWVVINADPFFVKGMSKMATKAMSMTPWEARKSAFETQVGLAVHRHIDKWLPHFVESLPAWIYYRSLRDGSIFVSATKGKPTVVDASPSSWELTSEHLQTFEEFQANMKVRGIGTVLTTIPPTVADSMIELAESSQTPHFFSKVERLTTSDGSHLDPDSAKRFSETFFRDLEQIVNSQKR